MKKPYISEETMWCVYGTCGLYWASNARTRRDAINRHLNDMGDCNWATRKAAGDRVVKVRITPL